MIIETIILGLIVYLIWLFGGPVVGALFLGAFLVKTVAMFAHMRRASLITVDTLPPWRSSTRDGSHISLSFHRHRHGDFYGKLGPYVAWELTYWKKIDDRRGTEEAWRKTWVVKDEPPRTKEEAIDMGWYMEDEW